LHDYLTSLLVFKHECPRAQHVITKISLLYPWTRRV